MEINRDKLIWALRDNCKCLDRVKNCAGCAEKYPWLCKQERQLFKAAADMLEADGVHLERKQATSDKTSKWEPIIDPPPSGDVMAYSKKSGGMAVGYIEPHYSEVGNEFICANGLEPLFDVTHWMPLPEPPEEVEA